jgi:hypothetical protein
MQAAMAGARLHLNEYRGKTGVPTAVVLDPSGPVALK